MAKRVLTLVLAILTLSGMFVSCENKEECFHTSYREEVSTEATCFTTGDMKYTCNDCGHSYTDWDCIPPIDHDWQAATCDSAKKCKYCDITDGYSLGHEFENGTCTSYGTCKRCGAKEAYMKSHTYSGTTDGACTVCGTGTKFILPSTPTSLSYYTTSRCTVESITIERTQYSTRVKYELTLLLTSSYHKNGDAYSDKARVGWKLYDEDGIVVDSGTESSAASIKVGEKSKATITVYAGDNERLVPNKTYTLVFLNIA